MSSPHSHKYVFHAPSSIREARQRMKGLLLDIRNIEKQLGDPVRLDRDGNPLKTEDYRNWYSRIRASLIYKQTEYAELKDWVRNRRIEVAAEQLEITDPTDSRQLLIAAKAVLRDVLDGEADPLDAGHVYALIEQHLVHWG